MQTRDITRSRWWMPGVALFIGAVMFVAFAIGGDVAGGAISLAIMAGAGALFLFGRRGETLRGIGGPERAIGGLAYVLFVALLRRRS